MGRLSILFLSLAVVSLVFSESENVSINTEDEVPSSTPYEVKRVLAADALEADVHRVFTKRKWGEGDYTRREQMAILEAHNNHRREVSPESSDMNEMVWSAKLAKQAQEWSDGCLYDHPKKAQHQDYVGIGQNLFIKWLDEGGDNPPVAAEPVDYWYNEVSNFHYQQNSCYRGAVCGHYTQVVWAETSKVGCGVTFCPMARSSSDTYKNAWFVVCNYSPAGNINEELPYKSGQQCSACDKGFCREGMCSKCKAGDKGCECNRRCENCGTLNRQKCKCTCPNGFYGPACETHCEDTSPSCGAIRGWPAAWCDQDQHPYVRKNCPAMCKVCKPGRGQPKC